jgi:isopenicillin N synthase-like dioxygenase
MKAFALALDVPEAVFSSRVDESFWQLRLAAYPGISEGTDQSKSGLYQHSDFGILTFLLTDEHKGSLKVLAPNGQDWISADPIPVQYFPYGHAIVLLTCFHRTLSSVILVIC